VCIDRDSSTFRCDGWIVPWRFAIVVFFEHGECFVAALPTDALPSWSLLGGRLATIVCFVLVCSY
jgi:hypothetical protein